MNKNKTNWGKEIYSILEKAIRDLWLKGISSIRVNDQYRIEFTVSYQETETIIYICNILDLSNHYQ